MLLEQNATNVNGEKSCKNNTGTTT